MIGCVVEKRRGTLTRGESCIQAAFRDNSMASIVHNSLEKLEYVAGMFENDLHARGRCAACVWQDNFVRSILKA